MNKEEQRAFLLYSLGLSGPFWKRSLAQEKARQLGMIQIDSIRVTGLRNHEIAWAARADAPIEDLYALFYQKRGMIETHYPLFATRREWLPWFLRNFDNHITRIELYRSLRPVMRHILKRIREEGALSPADFDTERVPGGFNTVKASTRAMEYLYYEGKLQIAGRTKHFHRLFDLTERVAPELTKIPLAWKKDHPDFFIRSALDVLKIATFRQWQERLAHHWAPRGGMADAQRMLRRYIKNLPGDIVQIGEDLYAYKIEYEAWQKPPQKEGEGPVRLLAPLDNLLFHRKRLLDLFGITYKFEAYTPLSQRRFYFALPILYRSQIVGMIDPKKRGNEWHIDGLEITQALPPELLRAATHRFARLAGCDKITLGRKVESRWRNVLKGKIE